MDHLATDRGQAVETLRPYLLVLARMHLDRRLWAKLDPEDLVQATLHEALAHWDQFLGNGHQELKGWLRQTLLNNVRESLVYAIDGAFLIGAVLVAVACLVNFFLPELPLRKTFAEGARAPLEAVAAASPEDALATGQAHVLPDGRLDGQGLGDGVAQEREVPTRR